MSDFNRTEFAKQFTAFVSDMQAEADSAADDTYFLQKLREHFQENPVTLPVMMEMLNGYDHVNFQKALDKYLEEGAFTSTAIGFQSEYQMRHASISLLMSQNSRYFVGPVRYNTFYVGEPEPVTAYQDVLMLLKGTDGTCLALVISGAAMYDSRLMIEVMATSKKAAQDVLSSIRRNMFQYNTYRGKTLSLTEDHHRQLEIRVHKLPAVKRSDIILQSGVLEQVERLTVEFSERAEQLKACGRHIKRGLLLYGPPGTGKTYTAMYLASSMQERTVLLMTGRGMGLLESTVALARTLAPAMVILEDVDLIGEERSQQNGCSVPLLFELLNQMDGLASDIDIIFLLTTNRPEILEPALASRPGRIDQALEIPLPDAECRKRLFELYGQGLEVHIEDLDSLAARTEGASAAFIKELFRRAALNGDINGNTISIRDIHLDEALQELLARGGQLTQSLLGFKPVS